MILYIEIDLVFCQNYIGLEIWINSEILFFFFLCWKLWKLKSDCEEYFQFIELIIAKNITFKSNIYKSRFYFYQNIEKYAKKNIR